MKLPSSTQLLPERLPEKRAQMTVKARSLSLRGRSKFRTLKQEQFVKSKPQRVNLAQFKMAMCPLDSEGDDYFLKILRNELESLKKRLKHEII